MNLSQIVRARAADRPHRTAVICGEHTQTYSELYERSCRLANALAGLGVKPGERVVTLSDNCAETIEQFAAIGLGNHVRSALYTHNNAESNLYLLNLVDASALIVQRRHYDALAPVLAQAKTLRHVIVFEGDAPDGTLAYEELLAGASARDPHTPIAPEDPYIIRFSAGTTGKPKGILHTVAGWGAVSTEMTLIMPDLTEEDRYLSAGPLSHAAMLPMCGTLDAGGAIIVMEAFHPGRFLELAERHGATTTMLVPTMIQMIIRQDDARSTDLSRLRGVFYGAAPISETTLTEAIAVWGNIMYQMYGQSEAVPLTVLEPSEHTVDGGADGQSLLRSAGRATPNTELRIVDEGGFDVPLGEVGEIAARSPTAMVGIWRDQEATAQRITADGFVLTRDMGYLDAEGYLYLADRKEDMIISGGFNIWPAELENALCAHPAVADVAVVGVPHPKWGETPVAFVVRRADAHADEDELIEWTREKVGAVKRVTAVQFVDSLPKTPIGKVLRRVVRDTYWQGAERNVAGA
jgi:acyl-CoA synthetase (AMP-forming)/AMP-acid ligase II